MLGSLYKPLYYPISISCSIFLSIFDYPNIIGESHPHLRAKQSTTSSSLGRWGPLPTSPRSTWSIWWGASTISQKSLSPSTPPLRPDPRRLGLHLACSSGRLGLAKDGLEGLQANTHGKCKQQRLSTVNQSGPTRNESGQGPFWRGFCFIG